MPASNARAAVKLFAIAIFPNNSHAHAALWACHKSVSVAERGPRSGMNSTSEGPRSSTMIKSQPQGLRVPHALGRLDLGNSLQSQLLDTHLSHFVLLDLAGDGYWKTVYEFPIVRYFEVRQI